MPIQMGNFLKFYVDYIKTLEFKSKQELIELLANEGNNISNDISLNVISEQVIKDIDLEINELDEEIKEKFIVSANQLKKLLKNEYIKNLPDVLMFNKGYVGLEWRTSDDDSIFIYSIPDNSLFYNRVGVNFSETQTLKANKENFSGLIRMINIMI